MVAKLSDKFAELSVATRKAEDAISKAQKQTSEKIEQLRDEAHSNAQRQIAEIDAKLAVAKGETATAWDEWRAKVKADVELLKNKIETQEHKLDVKHKEHHADKLEEDAVYAVEYAIYAIEYAQAAILDAIAARAAATEAASS